MPAASTASHGLAVTSATLNPTAAPMIIMPSTPRFRLPVFSPRIPPSVPKRMGVPICTEICKNKAVAVIQPIFLHLLLRLVLAHKPIV